MRRSCRALPTAPSLHAVHSDSNRSAAVGRVALFPLFLLLVLLFLPLLAQDLVINPIRNLVLGAAVAFKLIGS
jgi:hypothetical protein